jgi:uncharacterized protein YbcI
MTGTARSTEQQEGSAAARISTGAVQLLHQYTGRGPTKAKTTVGADTVTILLADTLTKGERVLAENGRGDTVLSTRSEFQRVMREDLTSLVEQSTGRRVIAFMSDNHIDPDYAVEVFVLEPPAA